MQNENFCSFCVLESHVKTMIINKKLGSKTILPYSVVILLQKISN